MKRRQEFTFGFCDSLLAEIAGVPQRALHFDPEAIGQAYEELKPLAKRLGVPVPQPHLAGFGYTSIVALGAKVEFSDFEPNVMPLIHTPEEIDHLQEPDDYLGAELIQKRLHVASELRNRYPKAPTYIGHSLQGPVTSAVLLMGQDFFLLPYDDPNRAHRLLGFCVKSALNYDRAISEHFGEPIQPGPKGIPDDFAGMFSPPLFKKFVVPYWEELYRGLQATERYLHSELLRVEHLPFLKQLQIDYYDPSADQYLTPELLQEHCPCPFMLRIQSWHVRDLSAKDLQEMYRYLSEYEPYVISFYMERLAEEPKIHSLLEIARQMNPGLCNSGLP